MNNTTHYELKKPEATDFYSIDDFNDNADIIDTLIYEHGEGAEQESSPAGTDFLQLIGGSDSKLYKALISDIADTVLRKLAISTSETGLASGSVIEKINSLNGKFAYKSGISLNDLRTAGLYYCDSVSDTPTGAPWTAWVVEVFRASSAVKQIAYPVGADTGMYTRRSDGSSWTDWINASPINQAFGDLSTIKYVAKPKGAPYGSFFIIGTVGGIGAVALVVTINNSAISSIVNLVTGAAWTNTNFTITYSVTNGVGYIGLKTTSSSGSNLSIIAG